MSFSGLTILVEYLLGGLQYVIIALAFNINLPDTNQTFQWLVIASFAYLLGLIADNLIASVTKDISYKINKSKFSEERIDVIYNAILLRGTEGLLKRLNGFESTRRFVRISLFNSLIISLIFATIGVITQQYLLLIIFFSTPFLLLIFLKVDKRYRDFLCDIGDIYVQNNYIVSEEIDKKEILFSVKLKK